MQKLLLTANFNQLERLAPFIQQAAPLSGAALTQVVLAVHELCANIVEHAYAGLPGEINVEVVCESDLLIIIIRDSAPRAYAAPSIQKPDPLTLPESGWGMYILDQIMDHVDYRRAPFGNEWRLWKLLNR